MALFLDSSDPHSLPLSIRRPTVSLSTGAVDGLTSQRTLLWSLLTNLFTKEVTAGKSQCRMRIDTCSHCMFETTVGGAAQDSPEKQNQRRRHTSEDARIHVNTSPLPAVRFSPHKYMASLKTNIKLRERERSIHTSSPAHLNHAQGTS